MTAVLIEFESGDALAAALARLDQAGIREVDTFTPMPGDAPVRPSLLPLWMFVAGITGFVGVFALMSYADVEAYPLNIGGRPEWAWPTLVPIAFELGVLCAMVTGFVGYFIVCRMPRLYDPVDECERIRRASRDGWFVQVRSADPAVVSAARSTLEPLGPTSVQEFEP